MRSALMPIEGLLLLLASIQAQIRVRNGNVELDGPKVLERVWVGYFLSHRTLKIPSSINKPCLLSRRFLFSPGNGERLVMNRKGPWDEFSLAFCLLPAFLYAHIFIETETSG